MSKQLVSSSRFASIEVTGSAKFNKGVSFDDLVMSGASVDIVSSSTVSLSSTSAAGGVTITSVGEVVSESSEGANLVLGGFQDVATPANDTDGSAALGFQTDTVPSLVVEAAFDSVSKEARLAFHGATPVAKPTAASLTPAAFVAGSGAAVLDDSTFGGYTVGEVVSALQTLGLLA